MYHCVRLATKCMFKSTELEIFETAWVCKAWFIRQSPTVARLGDSRRQSRVCLYFSWRLSPAQVGDCRQQSPTVVFKVQQCWTFNSVASSRWHFPSNQRTATAFGKVTTHADSKEHLLLNIWNYQFLYASAALITKATERRNNGKTLAKRLKEVVSRGQTVPTLYPGI